MNKCEKHVRNVASNFFESRLFFCVGSMRFRLFALIGVFVKLYVLVETLYLLAKYVKSFFSWQHLILRL